MDQQKSSDSPVGVPAIVAGRLRAHRERRGFTVRSLASSVGVSPSLVSQIENGKANPSVATLYAIVSALDISLDELFSSDEPGAPSGGLGGGTGNGTNGSNGSGASGGADLERVGIPAQPRELVLRAADRPSISLGSNVTWERLTPTTDPDVDFLFVTYDVGGASCPPDGLMRHNGREYGLVLSGHLGATVGFDSYELGPGDSIVLPSTTPHRFWTIGNEPTTVVWTVVGRTGDPRGGFEG
jgi:DNA-binding XRE family transcriptional regulator/mannose-6-phosphate isomerase-like protein (cupin superfamily)